MARQVVALTVRQDVLALEEDKAHHESSAATLRRPSIILMSSGYLMWNSTCLNERKSQGAGRQEYH